MKIPSVTCGTHGKQPQAFVCVHIVEALKQGAPNGFWWSRGEDGVWDALCNECNNLSQEAFDKQGQDTIATICLGCFEDAATLNDVELEEGE